MLTDDADKQLAVSWQCVHVCAYTVKVFAEVADDLGLAQDHSH